MFEKRMYIYKYGCLLFALINCLVIIITPVYLAFIIIIISAFALFSGAYCLGEIANKGIPLETKDLSDGEKRYEVVAIDFKNVILISEVDSGMNRVKTRFLRVSDPKKFQIMGIFKVAKELSANNFSQASFKEGSRFIIPYF